MPATETKPEKTWDIDELLSRRVRTVSIQAIQDEPDATFTVRYSPDAFSGKLLGDFNQAMSLAADDPDASETAMAEMSAKLIRGWSLTSGGNPLPVAVETLKAMGLLLMAALFEAINTDYAANFDLGKAPENKESTG